MKKLLRKPSPSKQMALKTSKLCKIWSCAEKLSSSCRKSSEVSTNPSTKSKERFKSNPISENMTKRLIMGTRPLHTMY
jgi:hypothetical protein